MDVSRLCLAFVSAPVTAYETLHQAGELHGEDVLGAGAGSQFAQRGQILQAHRVVVHALCYLMDCVERPRKALSAQRLRYFGQTSYQGAPCY